LQEIFREHQGVAVSAQKLLLGSTQSGTAGEKFWQSLIQRVKAIWKLLCHTSS